MLYKVEFCHSSSAILSSSLHIFITEMHDIMIARYIQSLTGTSKMLVPSMVFVTKQMENLWGNKLFHIP